MKRSDQFILHEINDTFILVPFGDETVNLNGVVKINETSKFLWDICENEFTEDDLIAALINEYKIDVETAKECAEKFIIGMKEAGCII